MPLNDHVHTLSVTAGTVTAYLLNLYADYKLKAMHKQRFLFLLNTRQMGGSVIRGLH